METLRNLANEFTGRWNQLGPVQRFALGSIVAGVAATIVVSTLLLRHVSYSVLYAGLDTESASRIVEALREKQVPFRLSDSGRTIMVPEAQVYTIRLDLAGEDGIGRGGTGYEIFDKSKFGMTTFMQKVNYRRALEGELTRTITEMDEIIGARIHLVMPERKLFSSDGQGTTASVMVRLRPGVTLSRRQIDGIASLVSGSVEGLEPMGVNIVDYYGNLLSSGSDADELESQGAGRMEMQANYANSLEQRAQSLMDRVVGPGNSVVRVSAELDFERIERNSEIYDPENSVVRSEEISEETGANQSEYRSQVTNFEINKTVEHIVSSPGDVKRLTVAVSVAGTHETTETGEELFVPRTKEELEDLAQLVKNSVGLDPARGDQFHIASVQFNREHLQGEQAAISKAESSFFWRRIIEKALVGLGIAVVGFLILRFGRGLAGILASVTPPAPPAVEPAAAIASDEITIEDTASMIHQVSEMAKSKPHESAELIREMIGEDE